MQVDPIDHEREVVAVRPDQRDALVDLALQQTRGLVLRTARQGLPRLAQSTAGSWEVGWYASCEVVLAAAEVAEERRQTSRLSAATVSTRRATMNEPSLHQLVVPEVELIARLATLPNLA